MFKLGTDVFKHDLVFDVYLYLKLFNHTKKSLHFNKSSLNNYSIMETQQTVLPEIPESQPWNPSCPEDSYPETQPWDWGLPKNLDQGQDQDQKKRKDEEVKKAEGKNPVVLLVVGSKRKSPPPKQAKVQPIPLKRHNAVGSIPKKKEEQKRFVREEHQEAMEQKLKEVQENFTGGDTVKKLLTLYLTWELFKRGMQDFQKHMNK